MWNATRWYEQPSPAGLLRIAGERGETQSPVGKVPARGAHVTRANGREAGQEEIMSKVREDPARVLEKAMAHANAENTRLHRPERYRRERRKQWRMCGDR